MALNGDCNNRQRNTYPWDANSPKKKQILSNKELHTLVCNYKLVVLGKEKNSVRASIRGTCLH